MCMPTQYAEDKPGVGSDSGVPVVCLQENIPACSQAVISLSKRQATWQTGRRRQGRRLQCVMISIAPKQFSKVTEEGY